MKTLKLVIIFTALAFIGLGCNQKKTVNKHYHNDSNESSGTATSGEILSAGDTSTEIGGETHGGDVLYARAEEIRFLLKATESEVEEKYLNKNPWLVRRSLNQIFVGLKYLRNIDYVNDKDVENVLLKMFDEDSEKDIFYDIQNVKFQVVMPEEGEKSSFWKWGDEKQNCLNVDGKASTASAKLNDVGGDICVDASRLALEAPEFKDFIALLIHEFAHHYGADEIDSRIVQSYVLANVEELLNVGRSLDYFHSKNRFVLDASERSDHKKDFSFEITTIEKPYIDPKEYSGDFTNRFKEFYPTPLPIEYLLEAAEVKFAVPLNSEASSSLVWTLPEEGETKPYIYQGDSKSVENGTLSISPPCGVSIKVTTLVNGIEQNTVILKSRAKVLVSKYNVMYCEYPSSHTEAHPDLDPEVLTILF